MKEEEIDVKDMKNMKDMKGGIWERSYERLAIVQLLQLESFNTACNSNSCVRFLNILSSFFQSRSRHFDLCSVK